MNFEGNDIQLNSGIKCRKLKADKLNPGKFCALCKSKDNLYSIEYDLSEYETVGYGIHCRECWEKIFGLMKRKRDK